jgi:hypothetical protein
MLTEIERRAIFTACPMVEGFLSTALEDLQLRENEEAIVEDREARDCGTIYTCPDATFLRAKAECEAFAKAAGPTMAMIDYADAERLGSDLYMERAGHGVGFQDRDHYSADRDENRRIGEALSGSVEPRGTLELYIGDDGQAWIVGGETL